MLSTHTSVSSFLMLIQLDIGEALDLGLRCQMSVQCQPQEHGLEQIPEED